MGVLLLGCAQPAKTPDGALDCGTDDAHAPGQSWTDDKRECFVEAEHAGKRARLVVVLRTEEGGAIKWTLTTDKGRIEVVYDNSGDTHASHKETRTNTCAAITAAENKKFQLTGCDTTHGTLTTP
jgi:hypothetical protein